MPVEARDLFVSLGKRQVLHGISASVSSGEVVGLIGPNGAGKSTLMRALSGQLGSTGSITIAGRALAALSIHERARQVAYLPQQRIIGWPLSVETVVGLGRLPWRAFGRDASPRDREIAAEAMAIMDVAELAGRPATELSGGEQARVLAARAIAQDTPVLLADEPVSGLDPAHQLTMMMALKRLAGKGRAVLVSLHDLTLAARWCDRIIVIDRGRVAAEGEPLQVMTAAMLGAVFGIAAHIDQDEGGLILAPVGLAAVA